MLRLALGALAVGLPLALADCSSPAYNAISSFAGTAGCLPDGYSQTQDVGNTTPDALTSRCAAGCAALASCEAYIGQLFKAADSNLYTGQCFFYSAAPIGPKACADHPATLIAGQKDHTNQCLSSAAADASAYCSSLLQIPVVTVYTSTSTPVKRSTLSQSTTKSVTSLTKTTTLTTSTTTRPGRTTVTVSSTSTTVVSALATTTITSTSTTSAVPAKRSAAAAVPPPGCLSSAPSSRITSACSCLSVTPSTTYMVSIAPTSTSTVVALSKTTTTSYTTSVKTQLVKETTTLYSSFTSVVSTLQTTTSTSTSTSTVVVYTRAPTPVCGKAGYSYAHIDDSDDSDLVFSTGATNREGCKSLCDGNGDCKSWSYDESYGGCILYKRLHDQMGFVERSTTSTFYYDKTCSLDIPGVVCGVTGSARWSSSHVSYGSTAGQTFARCKEYCGGNCRGFSMTSDGRCEDYTEYIGFLGFTADPSGPRTFYDIRCS